MKSSLFSSSRAALAVAFAFLAGSASAQTSIDPKAVAVAQLQPAKNYTVTGTVQFIPADKGVRVVGRVMNLSPGQHGFHVHENGDLSAPDLTSAGGHYNPTNEPHGAPKDARRHMGDMGNIEANSQGVATIDYVDPNLSLDGPNSIIGRAVIVHAKPDDLKSQPSGDAGDRVAGGVIGRTAAAQKHSAKKAK